MGHIQDQHQRLLEFFHAMHGLDPTKVESHALQIANAVNVVRSANSFARWRTLPGNGRVSMRRMTDRCNRAIELDAWQTNTQARAQAQARRQAVQGTAAWR